ncbi:MAG: hypothetical protein ORN57_05220 [Alphaproteobacteria bacterium]|nr:hypothetical protein [Alphaproteobacteria bacterium]
MAYSHRIAFIIFAHLACPCPPFLLLSIHDAGQTATTSATGPVLTPLAQAYRKK